MAQPNHLLEEWENLVKKQLKTEDIYSVLSKENLEGISVKPYYTSAEKTFAPLPKVEESTQLVAEYEETLEDTAYAFLLRQNVENLTEKSLYIENAPFAWHLKLEEENRYFSLVDVFEEGENKNTVNTKLALELLSKNFERAICVDVSLHQNAGASIVQQLSFALAKTQDLVENFGPEVLLKLIYRFAVGSNYFFEIAKLRAFKVLFNQFSREYQLDEIPYIFAETSLRNKTLHDAENNLIRSALELSAAMIAGADAVLSNDYNLKDSTALSREISFKQQLVLAYESILNVFEDGAGGSYYVEEITRQLAEKSWSAFLDLEERGGYAPLLAAGEIASQVYEQAVREQEWVREGKIKLVGVNLFPALTPNKTPAEMYDKTCLKKIRLSEMYE